MPPQQLSHNQAQQSSSKPTRRDRTLEWNEARSGYARTSTSCASTSDASCLSAATPISSSSSSKHHHLQQPARAPSRHQRRRRAAAAAWRTTMAMPMATSSCSPRRVNTTARPHRPPLLLSRMATTKSNSRQTLIASRRPPLPLTITPLQQLRLPLLLLLLLLLLPLAAT